MDFRLGLAICRGHRHGHEIGLGEIAVVARLLLVPLGPGDSGGVVPAAGLLGSRSQLGAGRPPLLPLPRGLVDERPLDRAEAVHVFDLADRRLRDHSLDGDVEVHVRVDPQAPLLHVAVAHAEVHQEQLQLVEPGSCLLWAAEIGLRDDLAQRRAGPVEVDPAVGLAGRLVVHALARVLLEVHADDADLSRREGPLRIAHLESPVGRERQVVLADLVALRQVRVVVVLPVPLRERGDGAVERERRADREFEGVTVHDRQRSRKAEADGADLRVRRSAERRGPQSGFGTALSLHQQSRQSRCRAC